jgi:hypothetical protein
MTQEFGHGHQQASSTTESRDVDRDPHPGRASRSALMRKPDHAIVSGLHSTGAPLRVAHTVQQSG